MLSKDNQSSNTGQNIQYLLNEYKILTLEDLLSKKHEIKKERVYPLEKDEQWKPSVILELSLARLGLMETGLEDKVAEALLEEISIS